MFYICCIIGHLCVFDRFLLEGFEAGRLRRTMKKIDVAFIKVGTGFNLFGLGSLRELRLFVVV